jgi:hypothetical protein
MDVAELLARRELLVAAQAPQNSYVEWISTERSTSDGYSIYPRFLGRWGFGYAERNQFSEREVFRSEAEACRYAWRKILTYSVSAGHTLYPFEIKPRSRALELASVEPAILARNDDYVVRAVLAQRTDQPELLTLLSRDKRDEVVWRVAANPATPVAVLERLARHRKLRPLLAMNPALPAELLEKYTHSSDISVLWRAVRNPAVEPERLVQLSTDKSFGVRWGVAANVSTPATTLSTLAADDDDGVRLALALNPSTPAVALAVLINTDFGEVRRAVAQNPSASAATLESLAAEHAYWVAQNPAISPPVLAVLALHPEVYARSLAAENPLTPVDALEALAHDGDAGVRAAATAQLGNH